VYFPLSGMISILTILRDDKAIETSTIGKDGYSALLQRLGSTSPGCVQLFR
jgi:hypothetical protein